jgi:hypothetical protein
MEHQSMNRSIYHPNDIITPDLIYPTHLSEMIPRCGTPIHTILRTLLIILPFPELKLDDLLCLMVIHPQLITL